MIDNMDRDELHDVLGAITATQLISDDLERWCERAPELIEFLQVHLAGGVHITVDGGSTTYTVRDVGGRLSRPALERIRTQIVDTLAAEDDQ